MEPIALTDAEWRAFQAVPDQGYSHRFWVDHKIAQRVRQAQEDAVKEAVDDFTGGGWHEAYDRANIHPDYITRTGMNVVNNWFHEYAEKYAEEN